MSRRIEIELTSARPDGSWTWRAAGAREPKGVMTASLLPPSAKPGDVLRAEVEQEIDGINVVAILPSKSSSPLPEGLLEIKGTRPPVEGGVSSDLRRPLRDSDTRERRGRRDGDKRGGPVDRKRPSGPRPETRGGPRPERSGERSGGPRPERAPRPPRAAPEPKPKPKRLAPGRTHRDALLASLPEAERRVAEQVMSGGVNAVRQSLEAQSRALAAEGKDPVDQAPILTLADDLLPQITAAEWRDFAEAAVDSAEEISLRDLRSVVAKSNSATRDDETRLLAARLREALDARVEKMKQTWVNEIAAAVKDGRLVRALKISGQPPEPGSRFPEELSAQLVAAANAALNADTMPDRWAVLAEAVATSSVRRSVVPAAPPKEVTDALKAAVTKVAGRVPAIAAALGIDAPEAPARPPRSGSPTTKKPPRQNVAKNVAKKQAAPAARPAQVQTGPRVMIGGRAIPPPPRPAAPQPVPSDEQAEDVARPVGDDVAVADVSPSVPAGNDEPDAGVVSGEPVVGGVADEQDVVTPEPETAEH
jgi:hypothetical protein